VQRKESVRLLLPDDVGLECLRKDWVCEIHRQKSGTLTFWDTYEWGLWFGGCALYSYGEVYHLCAREEGWLGGVLCEEKAGGRRRFWKDFETEPMRSRLEGMLGLRGLAPVVGGAFRLSHGDLRNKMGKIVCRLDWTSVSTGKREEEELLQSCLVMPLLGYEAEASHVVDKLIECGAKTPGDDPLVVLLQHANLEPQEYTLRPAFGLKTETSAREAVGCIVRTILEIAFRNVPGILNDIDTEFLHDYRICLRKIRSVLSLVKDVFPAEGTRLMRKALGDLARQTNRLRELDVYLLARDEYLGLLPPAFHPALDVMFKDFSAEREMEVQHVISKMRAASFQRLLGEIGEYFSADTRHEPSSAAALPVDQLIFSRIYKSYRKICRLAAGIGAETPDEVLHQVRVACKKLRYLMEFFSELIPGEEASEMQKVLRRLQGRLGEFNDSSVQQKSLLNYWEQKRSGSEVAPGLGGLVSILYHRQQQTREQIVQALEMFCGGSTAATFKRVFKQPAHVPVRQPRG